MAKCSNDPACTGNGCKCCPQNTCCPNLPAHLTCTVTATNPNPPFNNQTITTTLSWNAGTCQWEGIANFDVGQFCGPINICFRCDIGPYHGCIDMNIYLTKVGTACCDVNCNAGGPDCTCDPLFFQRNCTDGCPYTFTVTK